MYYWCFNIINILDFKKLLTQFYLLDITGNKIQQLVNHRLDHTSKWIWVSRLCNGAHILPVPPRVYPLQPPCELAIKVTDVAQHLLIAGAWFAVAGERRVVGHVARTLLPHQGVLPLLCLGELGGDDHEAQVDHEEWAHLVPGRWRRVKAVKLRQSGSLWWCMSSCVNRHPTDPQYRSVVVRAARNRSPWLVK